MESVIITNIPQNVTAQNICDFLNTTLISVKAEQVILLEKESILSQSHIFALL